jgi:hypothetical protein
MRHGLVFALGLSATAAGFGVPAARADTVILRPGSSITISPSTLTTVECSGTDDQFTMYCTCQWDSTYQKWEPQLVTVRADGTVISRDQVGAGLPHAPECWDYVKTVPTVCQRPFARGDAALVSPMAAMPDPQR